MKGRNLDTLDDKLTYNRLSKSWTCKATAVVNVQQLCSLLKMSQLHQDQELQDLCWDFAAENFLKLDPKEFVSFPVVQLERLLKRDDLKVTHEDQVFAFVETLLKEKPHCSDHETEQTVLWACCRLACCSLPIQLQLWPFICNCDAKVLSENLSAMIYGRLALNPQDEQLSVDLNSSMRSRKYTPYLKDFVFMNFGQRIERDLAVSEDGLTVRMDAAASGTAIGGALDFRSALLEPVVDTSQTVQLQMIVGVPSGGLVPKLTVVFGVTTFEPSSVSQTSFNPARSGAWSCCCSDSVLRLPVPAQSQYLPATSRAVKQVFGSLKDGDVISIRIRQGTAEAALNGSTDFTPFASTLPPFVRVFVGLNCVQTGSVQLASSRRAWALK
mmetsp:Transcript_43350/g.116012  ORF Transcript_43350/g.116012 Transcript_43350/m.116012 type:complete len:384 (+) Transcript_43350:1765-2916(+)